MKKIYLIINALLAVLVAACSSDEAIPETNDVDRSGTEIRLASRASKKNFQVGDAIGVYISESLHDPTLTIRPHGNFVDNMCFVLQHDGWEPGSALNWNEKTSEALFAAFYPYKEVKDAHHLPFNVASDQSTEAGYSSSDFLAGLCRSSEPDENITDIQLKHYVTKLVVRVRPGKGFSEEELAQAAIRVNVKNVYLHSEMNLSNLSVLPQGKPGSIQTLPLGNNEFTALVPAQHVQDAELIEVQMNGMSFSLRRDIDLQANKQYTFTVTITKSGGGIQVGIDSWDIIDEDYGGIVY